ncbi:hypothetical protein [Neoroseomonas soli]|uniref:Uncharacterized protein n=1 Tax=Neoroseomonas soli TaxID=1081025 RepID=A0A9X9WSX4_9PROT|nr:hypothetical protein [Neoroseomonas soli]MBR0670253.1 hypothetical protein [Neoroseomonas soli]
MTMNKFTEHTSSDAAETALAAEARLDAALADTFPASDPVAITVSEPPRREPGSASRAARSPR